MKGLVAAVIVMAAPLAWAVAGEADPYFRAIHCKAVWSELTPEEKASVPGTDAAIAAIDKKLKGFVAAGVKTARAIDIDISDFKAYSNFEAHQMKAWRDCVAFYAADGR